MKRKRAAKTADKNAEVRVETWTFSVDIPNEEEDDREPPEPDYDMQLEDQWLRQQDERSDPHGN